MQNTLRKYIYIYIILQCKNASSASISRMRRMQMFVVRTRILYFKTDKCDTSRILVDGIVSISLDINVDKLECNGYIVHRHLSNL